MSTGFSPFRYGLGTQPGQQLAFSDGVLHLPRNVQAIFDDKVITLPDMDLNPPAWTGTPTNDLVWLELAGNTVGKRYSADTGSLSELGWLQSEKGLWTKDGRRAFVVCRVYRRAATLLPDMIDTTDTMSAERVCYNDLLRDMTAKALGNELRGTQGSCEFAHIVDYTASSGPFFDTVGVGQVTDFRTSGDVFGGAYLGVRDSLALNRSGLIFANSSAPRSIYCAQLTDIYLHPRHGNVSADFTNGQTYPVVMFEHSTAPGSMYAGTVSCTEYYPGANRTDVASMNTITGGIGQPGIINAGRWSDTGWASQLLATNGAWRVGGYFALYTNRKTTQQGIASIDVLTASEDWQSFAAGDYSGPLQWTWAGSNISALLVNATASAESLGYGAGNETALRENGAIRLNYTTAANGWKLSPIAEQVACGNQVHFLNHHNAALVDHLLDFIPSGPTWQNDTAAILSTREGSVDQLVHKVAHSVFDPLQSDAGIAVMFQLSADSEDRLWLDAVFTEVVDPAAHDHIDVRNYRVTTPDTVGNVRMCGCASFPLPYWV